ncbi:MAG: sulfite exporter TauE/SafE family protein [Pseudomonadota bacterium]
MAIAAFLIVVFLGSYIQSVAGFAMAMLIVAVMGGFRLVELPVLAATVSLLTMVNVALALRGSLGQIQGRVFVWLAVGQVPAILIGVYIMQWLDANVLTGLEICLGLFITLGGLFMLLKPQPWKQVAGRTACVGTGVAGGLMGGLFGASGPVLGWFGFSQPLPLAAIRATLLACFALTTVVRTGVVWSSGGLTAEVLSLALLGAPVVVVGTLAGRYLAPPVHESAIKRMAHMLLLAMGIWILLRALLGV